MESHSSSLQKGTRKFLCQTHVCGMSLTCFFFHQVLGEVFAAAVAGGNFELPLGYSEVLQSLHCFNEKHNLH